MSFHAWIVKLCVVLVLRGQSRHGCRGGVQDIYLLHAIASAMSGHCGPQVHEAPLVQGIIKWLSLRIDFANPRRLWQLRRPGSSH